MYIKLGDIVEVLGTDLNLEEELWYGEIVGKDGNDYEIYYIEHKEDNRWEYCSNYECIEKESINAVSRTKKGDYAKSWATFGFQWEKTLDEHGNEKNITLFKHAHEEDADSTISESLDSCHSWSTSESDSDVSDLFDDTEENIPAFET